MHTPPFFLFWEKTMMHDVFCLTVFSVQEVTKGWEHFMNCVHSKRGKIKPLLPKATVSQCKWHHTLILWKCLPLVLPWNSCFSFKAFAPEAVWFNWFVWVFFLEEHGWGTPKQISLSLQSRKVYHFTSHLSSCLCCHIADKKSVIRLSPRDLKD